MTSAPFEEFQAKWAPSMVVGLGRLAGRTVGVLANNPLRLGGCLNSESAEKAARFVRLCDAFGIPLVVVVDVPGYLPGVDQEWGGVVRRGAKLLHAFGEATVPRVTLVTRKIYGGAYIAMNSRSLGATKVFAWPDAEVAVMGAKAAVGILHKRTLAAAAPEDREALHEELAAEHERIAGGVDSADRDRRRRRQDRPGPDPQRADPGAGRGARTPRPPQEHPAVDRLPALSPARADAKGLIPVDGGPLRLLGVLSATNSSATAAARSRSAATRPMRVRRSRMSSAVSAPSWVTAYSNSARVTSIPSATGSVGRSQVAPGDHLRRLGAEPGHQRTTADRPASAAWPPGWRARRPAAGCGSGTARRQTAQRDGPVEHVLRHVPVLGELAADHADHARSADSMTRARVTRRRCGPLPGVDQRPQPGVGADHVVGSERDVERGVHGVEQERDLLPASVAARRESDPGASSSVRPR